MYLLTSPPQVPKALILFLHYSCPFQLHILLSCLMLIKYTHTYCVTLYFVVTVGIWDI